MAKTKPGKKDVDSYSIKGTNKIVRRNSISISPPFVLCFVFSVLGSLLVDEPSFGSFFCVRAFENAGFQLCLLVFYGSFFMVLKIFSFFVELGNV